MIRVVGATATIDTRRGFFVCLKKLLTCYVNNNSIKVIMEIYWKNSKLRKDVEQIARSNSRVQKRMNSIKAADNFKDVVPVSAGRAHFLKGKKYSGLFAIDLERKGNGKRG